MGAASAQPALTARLLSQPQEALAAWVAWFRLTETPAMAKLVASQGAREILKPMQKATGWLLDRVEPGWRREADRLFRQLRDLTLEAHDLFQREFRSATDLPQPALLDELRRHLAMASGTPGAAGLADPELNRRVIVAAAEHLGIDPRGLSLQDLEREVFVRTVQQLAHEAQRGLRQADEATLARVEREVQAALDRMAAADREQLRRALGVDALTGATAVQAIRGGAAAGVALWMAHAAGIGLFMAFSSLLHAVFTGLLGLTLPFWVYMTGSTALAALTGPLGLLVVPAILGYLSFKGGWELRRRLLALLVTALQMPEPPQLQPPRGRPA